MRMEQKFINKIEELYKKYNNDVQSLREEQRPLSFGDEKLEYRKYDDLEAEILYMLVKEYKPSVIKELGCAGGWSCSWMLQALKEIGSGKCNSFDPAPVQSDLDKIKKLERAKHWEFRSVQAQRAHMWHSVIPTIDFLFIDALHETKFHKWCIDTLIEPIRKNGKKVPVVVHDVFINSDKFHSTCHVFDRYLRDNKISWFTASDGFQTEHKNLLSLRNTLSIGREGNLSSSTKNPSIFFILNDKIE